MPTVFNGTTVDGIVFNGTVIDTAFFNGAEIFSPSSTMISNNGQSLPGGIFRQGFYYNPSTGTPIGSFSPNPNENLTTSGTGVPAVNQILELVDKETDPGNVPSQNIDRGFRIQLKTIGPLDVNKASQQFNQIRITGTFNTGSGPTTETKTIAMSNLNSRQLNVQIGTTNTYIQTYQTTGNGLLLGFVYQNQYDVRFLGRDTTS